MLNACTCMYEIKSMLYYDIIGGSLEQNPYGIDSETQFLSQQKLFLMEIW